MKTVFELSVPGRRGVEMPAPTVQKHDYDSSLLRGSLRLPELSEQEVVRHYTALSKRAFGVDDGFYPLGSCTMKYNPKLHEKLAALPGFADVHPLTRADRIQGSLALIDTLSSYLCGITGMDAFTTQPAAGAHGEFTGLLLIKAYHASRGDTARTKVIIPDSAHGTNPASAVMAGFEVVHVGTDASGDVDIEALSSLVGADTAALMLTNPSTLGLFEKNVLRIADIVHKAGGLMYYDGANLNAVAGVVRPGDMGFDVVHLNLHKTFSAPHGGGGPGAGPVGCKKELAPFLPEPRIVDTEAGFRFNYGKRSAGRVTSFYGNFAVLVKALAYIVTLGGEGLAASSFAPVYARVRGVHEEAEGRDRRHRDGCGKGAHRPRHPSAHRVFPAHRRGSHDVRAHRDREQGDAGQGGGGVRGDSAPRLHRPRAAQGGARDHSRRQTRRGDGGEKTRAQRVGAKI